MGGHGCWQRVRVVAVEADAACGRAIKLVRHYDLLMTLQSTPVNHRSGRPVIIQLSVASTHLVSLTPKPPGVLDRRPSVYSAGTTRPRPTIADDRVAPPLDDDDENKVVFSSRFVSTFVVRQPITFRFSLSSDNRSSRVAYTADPAK